MPFYPSYYALFNYYYHQTSKIIINLYKYKGLGVYLAKMGYQGIGFSVRLSAPIPQKKGIVTTKS